MPPYLDPVYGDYIFSDFTFVPSLKLACPPFSARVVGEY